MRLSCEYGRYTSPDAGTSSSPWEGDVVEIRLSTQPSWTDFAHFVDFVHFAHFVDFVHFVDFMNFVHFVNFMDFVHFVDFANFVDFACPWRQVSLKDRRSVQTGIYSRRSAVVIALMTYESPFDIR